jgi:hypothetical protein
MADDPNHKPVSKKAAQTARSGRAILSNEINTIPMRRLGTSPPG